MPRALDTSIASGMPIVATEATMSMFRSRRRSASWPAARAVNPTPWSTVMSSAIDRSSAIRTSGRSIDSEPTVVVYVPSRSTTFSSPTRSRRSGARLAGSGTARPRRARTRSRIPTG